jgi:DNA-binding CsgD family transcriptional regulator
MSTPSSPIVDDNAAVSVTSYAARSISWDQTTLQNGTVIPAGVIFPDAALEERHDDESVITENPVEAGSVTNDHMYDLQEELELTYVWSPSGPKQRSDPSFLNSMYEQVLTLKQAKVLVTVVTGKRQYDNMAIQRISETTDRDTENILMLRIGLRQLLITFTQTVAVSQAAQQTMPQKTMPTQNGGAASLQPAPSFNTGG